VAACRYADAPAALVQQFKFSRHPSLACRFALAMAPLVAEHTPPDAVLVPAPSRRGTVRRRGFAGAVLIAREIARRTGRPLWNVLQARGGRSQKALSLTARRSNAAQAVGLRPGALSGRHVPARAVLVDDVLTTGTTADSCARRLLECGVSEVVVVVYGLEY
jgi:predicted amidophosphoribosyltransferase